MKRHWYFVPLLLIAGLILLLRPDRERPEDRPTAGSSARGPRDATRTGGPGETAVPSKSRERTPRPKMRTTASGLQYEVLLEGTGPSPAPADTVKVRYEGQLSDGTVFDRSDENQPIAFELTKVIAGWQEGLQLMQVGARYRFIIPPELAYGERGAGGAVPPNSSLTFVIELVEITPPETVIITESRIEMPVFSTRRIELVPAPETDDLPACP